MENSSFIVYTDQNNNQYIIESLANENNITNKGQKIIINNEKYIQVEKKDIEDILTKSNNTKTVVERKCNLVDKKDNKSKDPFKFFVYTDQNNNKYIREDLAYVFKFSNSNMVVINGEKYCKVTEDNIKEIIDKSNNTRVPVYEKCNLVEKKHDNPLIKPIHQPNFNVYTDQDNNLYVIAPFAYTYKIHNKGKEIVINDNIYIQVNKEDIQTIIEKSNYSRIPKYRRCNIQKETKTEQQELVTPKYFTYYELVGNKELYINDEILELCRNNDIKVNDKRTVILDKTRYYEISKEALDEIMKKTNYIGQKQSAVTTIAPTMKINLCKINGETYIPAGLYSKYSSLEEKKIIYIDGVKYVPVNEEEIKKTQDAYANDGIDTEIRKKEVELRTKDTDEKKKEEVTEPIQEEEEVVVKKENEYDTLTKQLKEKHNAYIKAKDAVKEIERKFGILSKEYKEAAAAKNQAFDDWLKTFEIINKKRTQDIIKDEVTTEPIQEEITEPVIENEIVTEPIQVENEELEEDLDKLWKKYNDEYEKSIEEFVKAKDEFGIDSEEYKTANEKQEAAFKKWFDVNKKRDKLKEANSKKSDTKIVKEDQLKEVIEKSYIDAKEESTTKETAVNEIKDADKEEVYKKIKELTRMLDEHDYQLSLPGSSIYDTLMLPESIKK